MSYRVHRSCAWCGRKRSYTSDAPEPCDCTPEYRCKTPRYKGSAYLCNGFMRLTSDAQAVLKCSACGRIAQPEPVSAD